jgi:hypothetical protein
MLTKQKIAALDPGLIAAGVTAEKIYLIAGQMLAIRRATENSASVDACLTAAVMGVTTAQVELVALVADRLQVACGHLASPDACVVAAAELLAAGESPVVVPAESPAK